MSRYLSPSQSSDLFVMVSKHMARLKRVKLHELVNHEDLKGYLTDSFSWVDNMWVDDTHDDALILFFQKENNFHVLTDLDFQHFGFADIEQVKKFKTEYDSLESALASVFNRAGRGWSLRTKPIDNDVLMMPGTMRFVNDYGFQYTAYLRRFFHLASGKEIVLIESKYGDLNIGIKVPVEKKDLECGYRISSSHDMATWVNVLSDKVVQNLIEQEIESTFSS